MLGRIYGMEFCLCLIFCSCEEVIEIEIPEEEIRLVINGVVRVDSTKEFAPIEIRATETSNFFNDNNIAQLENVRIFFGVLNERAPELTQYAIIYLQESEPESGVYTASITTDILEPGMVFYLFADYKDKEFAAFTTYQKSVPIDAIEVGEQSLFEDDDLELVLTITDGPQSNEYYVFDFGNGEFLPLSDEFFNGSEFSFSYFLEQNVEIGDELTVKLLGSDLEFYNFINKINEQAELDGGIFQSPATTVRGNIFDVTGLDNIFIKDNVERPLEFALGYFAMVEEYKDSLVIE